MLEKVRLSSVIGLLIAIFLVIGLANHEIEEFFFIVSLFVFLYGVIAVVIAIFKKLYIYDIFVYILWYGFLLFVNSNTSCIDDCRLDVIYNRIALAIFGLLICSAIYDYYKYSLNNVKE